jgi:hypothetical protein
MSKREVKSAIVLSTGRVDESRLSIFGVLYCNQAEDGQCTVGDSKKKVKPRNKR